MTDWTYKIFARHNNERVYYEIDLVVHSQQERQIVRLKEEFGIAWDLWIERFPREHPHAALQRRLNSRLIHARAMTASGRRKADGDFLLNDIKIKHAERASINDLLSRPQKREAIQPALLAPPAPPDEI